MTQSPALPFLTWDTEFFVAPLVPRPLLKVLFCWRSKEISLAFMKMNEDFLDMTMVVPSRLKPRFSWRGRGRGQSGTRGGLRENFSGKFGSHSLAAMSLYAAHWGKFKIFVQIFHFEKSQFYAKNSISAWISTPWTFFIWGHFWKICPIVRGWSIKLKLLYVFLGQFYLKY